MLDYVRRSLSPGEELIHIGHFHWMYTLAALMNIIWGLLGCALCIGATIVFNDYFNGASGGSLLSRIHNIHPGIRLVAFFCIILGLAGFAQRMVIRATTEIAVTNTRLIYKRGLVARYVGEMNIDRIEGVNVLQTITGRMLGYGRIMVRGMGVGEVILPPIANPLAFRRAIEIARAA